ncbi:DUF4407 domain-containing protein [Actinoplanes regularis]|uniref:DUF4407 domain-containing protein n=1 Tax=Actinoplanes regularis TaxID=52697 RepID=A0A239C4A6_9ACTN|nr:DUF4407 domain-containing protein [Actinoplanes regularis]GIE88117.1 hypothetical protein Are01nite_45970 [Actinoplanes regularis]SNS15016.1 protein of unknown function [Actinoplanes regularis]
MSRSPARALRAVLGVDEEILEQIPAERSRYTAMAGVILGTAFAAMVSMGIAIAFVRDGFPWQAVPIVVGWGLFVLAVDRWMMSSATTANARVRALRLLPRLLLALLVGLVVAEPLVLTVFGNEITEQSDRERKAELAALESDLLACNPVPGTDEEKTAPVGTPRCEQKRLVLAGASVDGKRAQIADLEKQAAGLNTVVQRDSKAYADIEAEARRECLGTSGPGLTGLRGQGPNCRRLRAQADEYRSDHRIPQNTKALADLRTRIEDLNRGVGVDADAFAEARKVAVAEKVSEARSRQATLGPLERMRMLGHLTDRNGYAQAGEWALRLFLILIDALPVLVKFLTGFTTYDEILSDRLRQRKHGELAVNKVLGGERALIAQLKQHSNDAQYRAVERRIQADGVRQLREVDAAIEREVDARADRLIGETPTLSFTVPAGSTGRRPENRPPTVVKPQRPPSQREPEDWSDRPRYGDRSAT